MSLLDASPGVIVVTSALAIAALYAFACEIREERIARQAVKRVRESSPGAWQSMSWFYRRLASPSMTIRVLRGSVRSDPTFEQQFDAVKRLERQKLLALGVAFLCIALLLIGTAFWGWAWG